MPVWSWWGFNPICHCNLTTLITSEGCCYAVHFHLPQPFGFKSRSSGSARFFCTLGWYSKPKHFWYAGQVTIFIDLVTVSGIIRHVRWSSLSTLLSSPPVPHPPGLLVVLAKDCQGFQRLSHPLLELVFTSPSGPPYRSCDLVLISLPLIHFCPNFLPCAWLF